MASKISKPSFFRVSKPSFFKISRRSFFEFLAACGISFLLMLLLTRSSFLYPYNNWDDSNSYFSMGKSMFHGILIYRDLFDQKGPYLYFLYGLCSLVSGTTFRGVFLMEILLGAADLLMIDRILKLFCRPRTAAFLSPILLACMCASKSFYWGGCAEEICLPFLLFPLYVLLRTLQHSRRAEFSPKDVFLSGLCCGFVFCVKFTLMGFFLGFALSVILTCRSFREFARLAGWFLLGTLLPFVPWVIYFGITGGLDDWYRVYIYTNVFLYSDFGANSHGASASQKIYDLAKLLYWLILDNLQYFILVIAGLLWMLLRRGASFAGRIAPTLMFALTFLFIYIGGAHLPYYAFPLTAFAVTGMAGAGTLLDRIAARVVLQKSIPADGARKAGSSRRTGGNIMLVTVSILFSLVISYAVIFRCSWNMDYLGTPKDQIFLTSFTEDINKDREAGIVDRDHTTLLNIGCLDSGLYTTTGIYPTCYWFQTQTLPGGEVDHEQLSYILEGRTDYIVARDSYPEAIFEHYEQIDEFHQTLQPQDFTYYLFRKKTEIH